MDKKRGISNIIATVSLILLTIVAITILMTFVVPFVRDNLNKSTECIDYSDYFRFTDKFGYNCYKSEGERIVYKLSIGAKNTEKEVEEKVEGFNLVFYKEGKSSVKQVINNTAPDSEFYVLNHENENIKIPLPGEIKTFVYNTTKEYDYVEIYVKLKSGRVCSDKTDSVEIRGGSC